MSPFGDCIPRLAMEYDDLQVRQVGQVCGLLSVGMFVWTILLSLFVSVCLTGFG